MPSWSTWVFKLANLFFLLQKLKYQRVKNFECLYKTSKIAKLDKSFLTFILSPKCELNGLGKY